MMLKPTNLTHCRHISADEVLYYKLHPTNSGKTLLKQEASISVRGLTLSHYMEDLLTSATSKNAGKGRQGLENEERIYLTEFKKMPKGVVYSSYCEIQST
ncbi:hypothetical protein GQX74_011097 [Glossina fuscipes]|nr:hypothetical protein GQX74_011097 [Glossina fuscipes]